MIKKTPLAFITGFLALSILIGWAEYKFIFQELLTLKDEQINALKEHAQDKSKGASGQSSQVQNQSRFSPSSTGNATVTGTGNVANTGNSSTINNANSLPKQGQNSTRH